MINKLINWLKGDSVAKSVELEVPYKVDAPVLVDPLPAGIEAVMVAPSAVVPEAIETKPVTVKAKYKKADLTAMTKAQLMELVDKHGVEVKARSTKEELVKVLVKV
jgi:hypothetical protein